MILKKISLKNFKCFEDCSVEFSKINLIQGAIGIGKSTILQALIFALYGYSESTLADLPTRGKAISCKITAIIEDSGHIIEICREYPLKLIIKEDSKTLKMSTSEGNSYLIDRFGSRQDFFQFRIVDAYSKETNLLEQGNVVFKKILFAGTDEKFNEVRNNLNIIKLEREKLNKDSVVIYKHHPSEKRLEILKKGYKEINELVISHENTVGELQNSINKKTSNFSKNESRQESNKQTIERLQKQVNNIDTIKSSYDSKLYQSESRHTEIQRTVGDLNKQFMEVIKNTETIKKDKKCYVCQQSILDTSNIVIEQKLKEEKLQKQFENIKNEDIELCSQIPILKENILEERKKKIEEYKIEIEGLNQEIISLSEENSNIKTEIDMDKEIITQYLNDRDNYRKEKESIQSLVIKLEGRLQQKEYIYTEQDVIIVKKALTELDNLSSIYLCETVRSLEPIINSVLEKIGFQITFDVDIKGKFNILLSKDDIQYKYTDLSCGQRLILQIALKLSLLLQQSKTGIILSDEGLSALENNNLEDIINLFKELNFQLVFVLHRASIEDPEINVIKLGGNDE